MALDTLAEEVEALFQGARRVARRSGHARVDAAHVLLAALEPPPDELRSALAAARVGIVELRERLERRLAELDAQVVARFPADQPTLRVFLDELARVLGDPALAAAEGATLLTRFEDYLEALLVREGWR